MGHAVRKSLFAGMLGKEVEFIDGNTSNKLKVSGKLTYEDQECIYIDLGNNVEEIYRKDQVVNLKPKP
jgi:hypothetical protein